MTMTDSRKEKITTCLNQRQEGVIILEDIHDPHNAAAVLRSVDAFGFQKVYFIFSEEKSFNPSKVGKLSSASANKWLSFKFFSTPQACVDDLQSNGFLLYGTALNKASIELSQCNFTQQSKIAIAFGNEHRGLSNTLIDLMDHTVILPMYGMVQSLNLSVTASLLMYEINRQRLTVNRKDFLLDKSELESLEEKFLIE